MSATDVLRKLAPEDLEEIVKGLDKSLHKHKDELHKQISEHLADIKSETKLHEKTIPTGCKVFGFLILVAASAISYVLGRKAAE
ncbi:MAG: hypothetical protein ABF968_14930 [Acetobacter sp.]|uniref:Uncharacterized protein n=3 Tax=Acetobacter TaxID=434 RepID=A0A6S6PHB3_ACEAC|nr:MULTISPECIES: hypothetical protein [Acetobacter]GBO79639.1 hypothetical protein AA0242T_0341 [Acetobacter aceti NRIC 0242]MCE0743796.1 hypothetical protein [Acetobacter sicerae]NHN92458.1 hypothetical protein [Acetobacter sicerae]TCS34524.1 hypothetical protein EDC15_103126 [Acetobacter aceti NBRC 14818]BCI65991.1 hypothetical protein AAJCM20276_06150 [Acetobacter aceti]